MIIEPRPLKYLGYTVVFQEVPNEVSLAINISGCPHRCEECHSQYLWKYDGDYIEKDLERLINHHLLFITCVCFMGGDQNKAELKRLCGIVKKYNLKTCLYSGDDNIDNLKVLLPYLDYLKVGSYRHDLGGLDCPNTNQRMYSVSDGVIQENITNLFQSKRKI